MSHSHSSSRPLPLSGSAPRVIRASPSSRSRASVAQGGNKHTSSSGPEQDSWAPLLSLSLSLQRADLLASQGSQWPPSVPYLVLHWVRVPSSKPPSVLPPVASFRLPPRPTWAFLARRPRLADLTLPGTVATWPHYHVTSAPCGRKCRSKPKTARIVGLIATRSYETHKTARRPTFISLSTPLSTPLSTS
ncbi:hypothetical protein VFPBJ_04126 [Purpureocillium lilacinum]|uniref:Uncharacterized protein n=1 Tax=Purpureocillium lilacinum TaxID=33203 RepID=A0A179GUU3_PURLI|nr:hypothetical protein VFPBJ_04126 [Purpureocillium lilacinum]